MISGPPRRLGGTMVGALVLGILSLTLAGCGEEPTPPRLVSFSPAILTVPASESLEVRIDYEPGGFELSDFQWTADAGEIEGNGQPAITYRAPQEAGDYRLAVTVPYGEEGTELSLDTVVKVTASAAPAVAEATAPAAAEEVAPEATESADETAEQATPDATAVTETADAAEEPTTEATATAEAPDQTATTAEATETTAATEEAAPETTAPAQATEEAVAAPTTEATATAPATEQAATTEAAEPTETTAAAEEAAPETTAPAEATEDVAKEPTTEATATTTEQAPEPTATTEAAAATETAAPTTATAETETPAEAETAEVAEAPAAEEPAAEPETDVAALTEAGAAAAGSRVDLILDKKRLTAVVQIGFEPFSFYGEDGKRTGFDIDMVREFARRWLDDPTAVTFLPVPSDARIPTLTKGRADLIAAAMTKTPARAEEVDFSLTYFKDGQRLLVGESSTIADVCDLAGKKVAAAQGSTSLDNLQAAAADCGFELGDNLVVVRRHEDAIEALLAGEVEAFTSDGVALENFAQGQPLKVVGNHFSEEPYGFAVPKGDARFQELINTTLAEMEADGTYAAIYERWFGDQIRPYPLEATPAEPETTEVTALVTTEAPAIVEPKTTPAEVVTEYVVQPGDTLSKISGKVYGDVSPGSWERIFEANKDQIGDDPSRIKVGMALTIPQ